MEKLWKNAQSSFLFGNGVSTPDKIPWRSDSTKLDFTKYEYFKNLVKDCRFYYRYDQFGGTVIDRMVDLAINDLVVVPDDKSTPTEIETFKAVKKDLIKFLRLAAVEFLTTGLVVPDIEFTRLNSKQLRSKRISRLSNLMFPTELSLKDSAMIEINTPILGSKYSYFLKISDGMRFFIQNKGIYADGAKDKELFQRLAKLYPELIATIEKGEDKILIDDELIITGRVLGDSQYPIPYMSRALEAMKHKRNLRKADYSVSARIINAILHVKIGSDEFPLTEDQADLVLDLQNKLKYNKTLSTDDLDRVFALFTNHVVDMKWIMPDINVLLDDKKFNSVNDDILIGLGFPRILITGETQRSFSSDANMATLAPSEAMRRIRESLMDIVDKVYMELMNLNSTIKTIPELAFAPINLLSLQNFYAGVKELYATGNLSRRSYAESFGFEYGSELDKIEKEQVELKRRGLPEFAPVPHSNTPDNANNTDEEGENE